VNSNALSRSHDGDGSVGTDRHVLRLLFHGRFSAHAGDAEERTGSEGDRTCLQKAGRDKRGEPLNLVAHSSDQDRQRCSNRTELEHADRLKHDSDHPKTNQRATRG